jgi:hypothetical protein
LPYQIIVDVDAVKRVLELWLKAVLSPDPAPAKQIPVYFDWQSGTKSGTKPFATYRITGPDKPTVTEDVRFEGGLPFLEGNRVFHCEVTCYSDGEEAGEMVSAIVESLEQPQYYSIIELGSASLATPPAANPAFQCSVATVREPLDLSELLETKWERRVMLEFDLIVSAVAAIVDGTPAGGGIHTVDVVGKAIDPLGNELPMEDNAVGP